MKSVYGKSVVTKELADKIVAGVENQNFDGWATWGAYHTISCDGAFSVVQFDTYEFALNVDHKRYGLIDVAVDESGVVFHAFDLDTDERINFDCPLEVEF